MVIIITIIIIIIMVTKVRRCKSELLHGSKAEAEKGNGEGGAASNKQFFCHHHHHQRHRHHHHGCHRQHDHHHHYLQGKKYDKVGKVERQDFGGRRCSRHNFQGGLSWKGIDRYDEIGLEYDEQKEDAIFKMVMILSWYFT